MEQFEIEPSWKEVLKEELGKPYLKELAEFVKRERASGAVYPPENEVFEALWKTPFDKVKVCIVGQDPYHGAGQAHGLCFSVRKGVSVPPSLVNIYKEIESDLGLPRPTHGCLTEWAEEGVLLLNTTLTVKNATPMSHHGKGWEQLTDAIIHALGKRQPPPVFLLWGKSAQTKCKTALQGSKAPILMAPHPSPFSAHTGFLGCRHFSKANSLLKEHGQAPVNWRIS